MTSVTLENVVKHYVPPIGSAETHPVSGLDHVNIKIEDGETVSVVGPSGCGKAHSSKSWLDSNLPTKEKSSTTKWM